MSDKELFVLSTWLIPLFSLHILRRLQLSPFNTCFLTIHLDLLASDSTRITGDHGIDISDLHSVKQPHTQADVCTWQRPKGMPGLFVVFWRVYVPSGDLPGNYYKKDLQFAWKATRQSAVLAAVLWKQETWSIICCHQLRSCRFCRPFILQNPRKFFWSCTLDNKLSKVKFQKVPLILYRKWNPRKFSRDKLSLAHVRWWTLSLSPFHLPSRAGYPPRNASPDKPKRTWIVASKQLLLNQQTVP